MTATEVLRYLQQEIHTTVAATTDAEGLPVTCAIDVMDAEKTGCIFSPPKARAFMPFETKGIPGAHRHEGGRYHVLRGGIGAGEGGGAGQRPAGQAV